MSDQKVDTGSRLVFTREGGYATASVLIHHALRPMPERVVIGAIAAQAFEQMPAVKAQFIALMQIVARDVIEVRTGQKPSSWERHEMVMTDQPPAGEETKH